MSVTRIHGTKSTAMLLGAGGLCGFIAFNILSNNPNEDGIAWGIGIGIFAFLCLYSGIRGKS